jgi:hypothetical protein
MIVQIGAVNKRVHLVCRAAATPSGRLATAARRQSSCIRPLGVKQ